MQTQHFDMCILGNGMAGSLMALLAHQQGLSVCVISKRRLNPKSKTQLPFETVTDSFFSCLAGYELEPSQVKAQHQFVQQNSKMISAWGTTTTVPFQNNNYFHIDKSAFNGYLAGLLNQRRISMFDATTCLEYEFRDSKWFIQLLDHPLPTFSCDLLVDATGRNSTFALKQKIRRVFFDDHYALFQTPGDSPLKEALFILESAQNGWWYSVTSNKITQAVFISKCALVNKNTAKSFYKDNFQRTYFIKQSNLSSSCTGIHKKDARCSIMTQTAGIHWISIGDSAFTLDPLSGMGNITIAENNITIFPLILDFLKTKNHGYLMEIDKINNRIVCSHLAQRRDYYAMEKRWLSNLFWN